MCVWRCSTNYVRVTLFAAGVEDRDTAVRGFFVALGGTWFVFGSRSKLMMRSTRVPFER